MNQKLVSAKELLERLIKRYKANRYVNEIFNEGILASRPLTLMTRFIDELGFSRDLSGKKVLDVGCYLGRFSALLVGMGAEEVIGMDNRRDFIEIYNKVANELGLGHKMFGVEGNIVMERFGAFVNNFDYVLFPGVLYHLTDPIIACRRVFEYCKPGGMVFLETAASDSDQCVCGFHGLGKNEPFGTDGAQTWFLPSRKVLLKILDNVGFSDVKVGKLFSFSTSKGRSIRLCASGRKAK